MQEDGGWGNRKRGESGGRGEVGQWGKNTNCFVMNSVARICLSNLQTCYTRFFVCKNIEAPIGQKNKNIVFIVLVIVSI